MLGYMAYWIWWVVWRSVVTLACTFTIQHIIHEQDGIWIDPKAMLIGTVCLVLVIRIWSMRAKPKEDGINHDSR
jgi:type VI protein secretion system component VasK